MDLNKLSNVNGIYFYKTDDFATIKLKLLFKIENTIEEIVKVRLLSTYLEKTNKKYKSFKEIKDKCKYFYNMDIDFKQIFIGKENFLSFSVNMLSPRVIADDYLENAMIFIHEMLFNPNFENNKLDEKIITNLKKDLINEEERNLGNPKVIRERTLFKEVMPSSNLCINSITDISYFKNIINNISDKELINLYNKIINESFYKGYVFGDINEKEIKIFNSLFLLKSKIMNLDFREFLDINSGESEVKHESNESDLKVVYKLENYDINKHYLYKTLSRMLNGSNGLCHKVLRSEMGLVYSSGAFINKYMYFGFMIIGAGISFENKEKCLNGIDKIFTILKDKNIVEDLLKFAKEKQAQDDYVSREDINEVIRDLEGYIFENRLSREELGKLIKQLTPEDIINELPNISKKYVFFGKGEISSD